MLKKLKLLFNTVKYLRFKQVRYQLYYRLKNKLFKENFISKAPNPIKLTWASDIRYGNSYLGNGSFIFLNLEKNFATVDWNYSEFGKLWTYNLTYFDYLNQQDSSLDEALYLINDFIHNEKNINDAFEPYPIALRGINWVKFLVRNELDDHEINNSLFNQYQRLSSNLEFHLLGNHLLENGFSLLFGAMYFKDEIFYKKAARILREELEEQILNDGGHFELSPMYHQIVLHRLLDSVNLLQANLWKQDGLLKFLVSKAKLMLGWLRTVTFDNGAIPMVNDSAHGIAPSSELLFEYAERLGLEWSAAVLKESGYRKRTYSHYECFLDVGNIGPDYIPGHAHADTFSFELYVDNSPFIVDLGTSTYEKNALRQRERSTESHNTVVVAGKNQSNVWGGFRVAERARILHLEENETAIAASHDGYKKLGVVHHRNFQFQKNKFHIVDELRGAPTNAMAFFHFHPSIKKIILEESGIYCTAPEVGITFSGKNLKLKKTSYNYAKGFNNLYEATVVQVAFANDLKTEISIKG